MCRRLIDLNAGKHIKIEQHEQKQGELLHIFTRVRPTHLAPHHHHRLYIFDQDKAGQQTSQVVPNASADDIWIQQPTFHPAFRAIATALFVYALATKTNSHMAVVHTQTWPHIQPFFSAVCPLSKPRGHAYTLQAEGATFCQHICHKEQF